MIFVHPLIDPVIVSFGFLQIRWYSLAYVIGFLAGIYLIKKINTKYFNPIKNKIIEDFFLWSVIAVILGGRLGYVFFYQIENTITNPLSIFYIWQGGMSFHGGLIGIIFAILFYSKYKNINFFQLSDLISVVAPIGLFLGRIANFINLELYGRTTNFFIAVIYPNLDNAPRHPSQIYEAVFEGIILFLILIIIFHKTAKNNQFGFTSSFFLIFYGVFRFLLEFLREPDLQIGFFFNLFTMGQLMCIPMIIFGIFIYIKIKNEYYRKNLN
tara:strand:+ start:310 stop:1116 length:807 start_codon:yes stop_codon:yes gene_type:complete